MHLIQRLSRLIHRQPSEAWPKEFTRATYEATNCAQREATLAASSSTLATAAAVYATAEVQALNSQTCIF